MQTSETGSSPPSESTVGPEHDPTEHIHLPPPTPWPATTAFGAAFAGFGLVTALPFSIVGLLIMAYGLIMWVQELRHEPH